MSLPVAIIPCNTGNIKSVYLALEYLGANPFVPFSLSDIDKAKELFFLVWVILNCDIIS